MPERPTFGLAVYSAIPTLRVDGQANEKVQEQLLAFEMREHETGMSALEVRFSNFGSFSGGLGGEVFEDGAVLKLGAEIQVYAGDVNAPTEIFRGRITALEGRFPRGGPPELVVLAEDALQGARMTRRSKTWENATLAQIVQDVAAQLGMTAKVDGLDGNIGTQQQLNESDLHFLRRLLARYDADAQVVGKELHAAPRAGAHRNAIEVHFNSQLREVRVLADLSHQVTRVTATGWDSQQGEAFSEESFAASFGPGAGHNSREWLAQALAERTEHLGSLAARSSDEACAMADAEFSQRMRHFVVARGVTEGNADLRVGSWLTLKGLGPRFSNTYYTIATVHRFDLERGYETEFTAECAYLGDAA